jgi:hypothetical protein
LDPQTAPESPSECLRTGPRQPFPDLDAHFGPEVSAQRHPHRLSDCCVSIYAEISRQSPLESGRDFDSGLIPRVIRGVNRQVNPRVTPRVSPRMTPRVTRRVSRGLNPGMTRRMSPEVTYGVSPRISRRVIPRVTRGVTCRMTRRVNRRFQMSVESPGALAGTLTRATAAAIGQAIQGTTTDLAE